MRTFLLFFMLLLIPFGSVCDAKEENWCYLYSDAIHDIYYDENNTKCTYRYVYQYNMYLYYLETTIKQNLIGTEHREKYKMKFEVGVIQGEVTGINSEIKKRWLSDDAGDTWKKEKHEKGLYKVLYNSTEWKTGEKIIDFYMIKPTTNI